MILGQGPKVEQFKLIGYTLYKYIWKKNKKKKNTLYDKELIKGNTERYW